MRKIVHLVVLGCFVCALPCLQIVSAHTGATTPTGDAKVVFQLYAPHMLYPLTKIFITGTFSGWQVHDATRVLRETSKGRYQIELTLPKDSSVEYKYNLGSWQEVEKAADGNERPNRRILVRDGLIQRDTVPHWAVEAVNRGYWKYEELAPFQLSFILREFGQKIFDARTYAEIDTVIKQAQIAWHQEAATHYRRSQIAPLGIPGDVSFFPGKHNIGGGGFTAQLYIYFIINMQKKGIDQDRLYYIARNYMIPQFLDEYPFLKKDLNPTKAFRIVEAENVYTIAAYIPVPDAQWRELYRDFSEMPKLIDVYLSKKMFERPDVQKGLERFQARLISTRPIWRAINALRQGRREEAFMLLKTDLLTSHDNRSDCVPTVLRLISDCVEAGEKDRALEVLDFLTTSTDDGLIHRDSLKVRYAAIDPQAGVMRYEEMVRSRPLFKLGVSDSTCQLIGQFVDAVSRDTVCLDSLRGKLVIVDVWTTWCAACRLELPDLNAFADDLKRVSNVVFLSVNGDGPTGGKNPEEIVKFAMEYPLRFPVLLDRPDSSLIQRWGVFGFPTKLLFDERGRMLRRPKDHFTLEEANAYLDNRVNKK